MKTDKCIVCGTTNDIDCFLDNDSKNPCMRCMEIHKKVTDALKANEMPDRLHPSHDTRFSDSSVCDEVCVNCGVSDITGGGWGKLSQICPKVPKDCKHCDYCHKNVDKDDKPGFCFKHTKEVDENETCDEFSVKF